MATKTYNKAKVGDIRPSQLLFTFGVGSIIELPNFSVMVMGLEDWERINLDVISEGRLLNAVKRILGKQVEDLCTPPYSREEGGFNPFNKESQVGVPVAPFPRWMYCPSCKLLAPYTRDSGLFELKANPYNPDKTKIVHINCTKPGAPPSVIPARFLVACRNGHLDDFPWIEYVHQGALCDKPRLRMEEFDISGNPSKIWIKCDTCEKSRSMSDAFSHDATAILSPCKGRHPHLRSYDRECNTDEIRTILLGASNNWFPFLLSALSIPGKTNLEIDELINEKWPNLKNLNDINGLKILLSANIPDLRRLNDHKVEELWQAIERKNNPQSDEEEEENLKVPEWNVFTQADPTKNTRYFKLKEVEIPNGFEKFISKVVLVERLREVRALIGFTRIESATEFGEDDVKRVSLSRRSPTWVPASEVLGEGIFIEFNEKAIIEWSNLPEVQAYESEFHDAHRQWYRKRGKDNADHLFDGVRYLLLHSFAHALMRQLSLECGYTAASIRERIYSRNPGLNQSPMAGVLIYTAAPDSEGTLGGLVNLGKPEKLRRHLIQTLEKIKICPSDPICSEHKSHSEGITLHGAACHACIFSPETSCESGNKYLDRSVLIPTFCKEIHYFKGIV